MQTTVTEPEWDDDSRTEMVALQAYEDTLCPLCGGPAEECQGEGADRRYVGTPPVRCYRRDAILGYQDAAADYPHPSALLWRTEERG